MTLGLVGRKCGMSRIFTEQGTAVPVTLIKVEPHFITQVKSLEKEGYVAVQVTTGSKKRSRINKAETGHFAKAGVEPGLGLWEFRLENTDQSVGASYHLEIFAEGQNVDVTGVTKGAGFAGTVKRHHFRTQDMTHGNSRSHRVPGSIGQNQTPGRVFKGKKMSGHLGVVQRTVQSLQIMKIDAERNLIAIKGSVPGAETCELIITAAVKG
jgi:large subunit ribosomal protein L3